MVMFKLLLIPLFILIVFGLFKLGKYLFKVADSMGVDETKDDITHKAELVEDVDRYKLHNSEKMRKSKSDSVETFVDEN